MTGFADQSPGGEQPRQESLGEAAYRVGGWLLMLGRLFGIKYAGQRHEDAAATLAAPILKRWPALAKWKAPEK